MILLCLCAYDTKASNAKIFSMAMNRNISLFTVCTKWLLAVQKYFLVHPEAYKSGLSGALLNNKFSFNLQFKNSIQITTPTTMAATMKLLVLAVIIGLVVLSIGSPTMADKCCCKNKNGALQLGALQLQLQLFLQKI